ncbi:MAG: carbohydrate-binding family 9-like protein [Clostridia bacterium]|nr:carbohydrate-binding family 9-like protein [Clostridia bacterium]MBQ3169958.1 carbohydrate-binding family 9-like protein [Clostridia bacterium]
MVYIVKKMEKGVQPYQFDGEFDPKKPFMPYEALNEAEIADYEWFDKYPVSFPAFARVGWNEDGLFVLMYAKEETICKEVYQWGSLQCMDSCMEFFVCPFPESDDRYLNIEINPIPTAHVGLGNGRYERAVYDGPVEGMDITVSRHEGKYWAISYRIPAKLLKEIFGKELAGGQKMRANFFKCSGTIHPHFGTWNHVTTEKPDFHTPDCFGELILE